MFPVRQKTRDQVIDFATRWFELGNFSRYAAGGRDAPQWAVGFAPEYDHVVLAPGARTHRIRRHTQSLRRTARDLNLLKFVAHRKPEKTAVRRPKRRRRTLRAGQLPPLEGIK